MVGVGLRIEGDQEAWADLSRFMAVIDKPFLDRALQSDLQQEFFRAEKKQFSTKGAFGSKEWPKLSKKYKARKAKKYPGKPIMRASDKLYKSLTSKTGGGIRTVTRQGKRFVLGSTVSYAIYHQSKAPRKKLPRRALIDLSTRDIESGMGKVKFQWIVQKSVLKQFKRKSKSWDVGPTEFERRMVS